MKLIPPHISIQIGNEKWWIIHVPENLIMLILVGLRTLCCNMFQINEVGSVQYGLMGTSTCMGDHKVKYIYYKL